MEPTKSSLYPLILVLSKHDHKKAKDSRSPIINHFREITAHNSSFANFNSVAIRMYVIRWLLLHLHQTGSTPSNWHWAYLPAWYASCCWNISIITIIHTICPGANPLLLLLLLVLRVANIYMCISHPPDKMRSRCHQHACSKPLFLHLPFLLLRPRDSFNNTQSQYCKWANLRINYYSWGWRWWWWFAPQY